MTSRTRKLAVVAVAVVVAMVAMFRGRDSGRPSAKPPLAVSFMRYGSNGIAIIEVTNRSEYPVFYSCVFVTDTSLRSIPPHTAQEVAIITPWSTVGRWRTAGIGFEDPRLVYRQEPSDLRTRIKHLLARVGIGPGIGQRPPFSTVAINLPEILPQSPSNPPSP